MHINNLKIRKFKNNKIIDAIQICTDYSLFVKGWKFELLFETPEEIDTIYIGYMGGIPSSCLIVEKPFSSTYHDFGVYVKKYYRKKGIGKSLVLKAKRDFKNSDLIYSEGIQGSLLFFEKCFETT